MRNEQFDANKIMPKPTATVPVPVATDLVPSVTDQVPAVTHKCRVCLQQGDIPVFSKRHSLDFPLSHYLYLICNITITPNDTLPKYLCQTCCADLDTAIKLRKTAMKSQLMLKATWLCHLNVNVKSCEKDQAKDVDLITLSPIRKNEIKAAMEYNDEAYLSPLQNEYDSDFEQTDSFNVPLLTQLEKTKANDYQDINAIENNPAPNLSLEDVKKLQTKTVPYDKYYKKVFTIDNKPEYQCRICKKKYKKGSISDHILIHLPESVSLYVCEVCGRSFKKFCVFHKHRTIHKNELPFECKVCPYKGRSKSLLQVHIKRVHRKEYNYQCTLCPKKFLDTNNLRYHLRRHEEPKFRCHTCHKTFYENGLLKKHVQSQHLDTVPHKCDVCGNLYKNRKNLLAHQIKVHKRKQVYNNRATYLKLGLLGRVTNEVESK